MKNLSTVMLLTAALLFMGCDEGAAGGPTGTPGWQKSADMYEAADFTWKDIASSHQLVGNWVGSKLIEKPAVLSVHPQYVLCVTLKFVHVDSTSTLYRITEDQYFNQAVKTEEEWGALKEYLAGRSTGNSVNPVYPELISEGNTLFWGTAEFTPGVTMVHDYYSADGASLPMLVTTAAMKISEDESKLLLQYSDSLSFVVGKN